ncbi:MAG: methyltransferase [Thermoproteota archaeon]
MCLWLALSLALWSFRWLFTFSDSFGAFQNLENSNLIQMLKGRWKELLNSGLYSIVRHTQYFGIIVVTLGLTIMSIQWSGSKPDVVLVWFIGVLGYVLLVGYEERYLSSRFEKEYKQYKQKVLFIFPVSISRMPEPVLTLIIALTITFMLTLI